MIITMYFYSPGEIICMKKRAISFVLTAVLLALALSALAGCGAKTEKAAITRLEQLGEPGRKIGVGIGTGEDVAVRAAFPDAQIELCNNEYMGYTALTDGKLDAFAYGKLQMELAIRNGLTGVTVLDGTIGEGNRVAVGLSPRSRIPDLKEKINAFIAEKQAAGTLDDMYNRWVVLNDETMPDIKLPANPDVHLRVGTTGLVPPYTYYVGPELCGYDIELARRFAAWLGADLEFMVYDYTGIIAAAQSGDVDCIMSELFVTPERAEAIPFSDTLFTLELGVMVRDTAEASGSFWASVANSFEKTFLRESRWKLFVQGIGTTLLVTVSSIVFGTALGFVVYLLCRKGNPFANALTRFCIRLVQGLPMVVLLMILYYVVFAKAAISGAAVSVIGFTLVFGAAVSGMLRSGVGAVDKGQMEAAYTLGYTDTRAFFRVVLPQALPHFFPAYKGEITATIKATAIVGYVAVQDLTKMGDIVRSRTYEAFFPLIAVAVFYFILADILTAVVNRLGVFIDPRRRKPEHVLKGVRTE